MSFKKIGIELEFKGEGKEEKGFVIKCSNSDFQIPIGQEVVTVDPNYFRPTEVDLLIGDSSKAKAKLGWVPKYDLEMLCGEMVEADLAQLREQQLLLKSKMIEQH